MRTRGINPRSWGSVVSCCTVVIAGAHLRSELPSGKIEISIHLSIYLSIYLSICSYSPLQACYCLAFITSFARCVSAPTPFHSSSMGNEAEPKELSLVGFLWDTERVTLPLMARCSYTPRILCFPFLSGKIREGWRKVEPGPCT